MTIVVFRPYNNV